MIDELKVMRLKKMMKYIDEDYKRFSSFPINVLSREDMEDIPVSDDKFVYLNLDEMVIYVDSWNHSIPTYNTCDHRSDNFPLTEYSFNWIYHDIEQKCLREMKRREEESKRKREREIEYEKLEEALLYVWL